MCVTKECSNAELQWLHRCLPIFRQPEFELRNKNGLVKVFFQFDREQDADQLHCTLFIVFRSKSSYNYLKRISENKLVTLLLRTYTRATLKCTADIKTLQYRNIDLDPKSSYPYESIYSVDYAGTQCWERGEKASVYPWFSMMHHYKADIHYKSWKKGTSQSHRPIVFLNTCNHLIGEYDINVSLTKFEWSDYPIAPGNFEGANAYAKMHIPTKCNLYSLTFFWKTRNGGKFAGRRRVRWITKAGDSIYMFDPTLSQDLWWNNAYHMNEMTQNKKCEKRIDF